MSLKPNLNSYRWNEYYLILGAAVLQAAAVQFADVFPDVAIRLINVMSVAVVTTLAWVREPESK